MKKIYRHIVIPISIPFLLCAGTTFAAESVTETPVAQSEGVGRTLEDFFTAAMEYSPRLKIAEEQWNIGKARARAATGRLLPQLTATANITENRQRALDRISEYRGERYSLQLRQVLFDWSAFNERGAAYQLENQSEALYYAELSRLLTDVSEKYFAALQAEEALESSNSELSAIQGQLNQFERMYELQMVQITDLYEARALLAEIQAEQILLRSEATLAQEALRSVSGLAVGDLFRLGETTGLPPVEGNIELWIERANNQNPEIQAGEFALEAADRRVSQQRGLYMPRVSMFVQQQQSNLGFDNTLLSSRTDTGYVGVDVTIPLFAGGSNRAAVSEAISQRSIASSELLQVNLDVGERTRMAYLRLQAMEQRVAAAERVLESRMLSAEASQRGFELGTVTSVDVLSALRDRYAAERDWNNYRYDYLTLAMQLRQSAGVLTAADLLDISADMEPPVAE